MQKCKIYIPFLLLLYSCEGVSRNEGTPLDMQRIKDKAEQAYQYNTENSFNTDFCILIDMGRHSGLKRFFVWDFNNNEIMHEFLVSHGCCDLVWSASMSKDDPTFSNVPQSYCSSLGKYRIGRRGYSNWGININYKLHGLESTNNNAYSRIIVLHSWDMVSDTEVYPKGTPEGWGCPAVSNDSMRILDDLLREGKEPVLMWMFE